MTRCGLCETGKKLHLFWILPMVADLVLTEQWKFHRHQVGISWYCPDLKAPPEGGLTLSGKAYNGDVLIARAEAANNGRTLILPTYLMHTIVNSWCPSPSS